MAWGSNLYNLPAQIISMTLLLLSIGVLLTAVVTLYITPYFLHFLWNIGIVGIDQQKADKRKVATSGGIAVAFGFFFGMMALLALNTFFFKYPLSMIELLAASLSTLAIALVGFFDDLYVRRQMVANKYGSKEYRVGLAQWQKPLLTLVAAIPLVAVSAGVETMNVPLVGPVSLGILYPLILVPIGVVVVSNAANMLAGMNGLESGMMAVASVGVGIWSYLNGSIEGAAIAFLGAGALLAFYSFNMVPARMLPGDSLTYFAGAMYASAVIVGNVEKIGFYIFLPWIVEAFLKLRSGFTARSYGVLQPDGTLKAPYEKIYSLTHVVLKGLPKLGVRPTERNAVATLILAEAVIVVASLILVKSAVA